MTCELRACCRRGGGAFLSTPDAPRDIDRSGAELPLIETLAEPPPIAEDVAFHEASHAAACAAYGGRVDSVTIANQPHVCGASAPPNLPDKIVMLLAGPAAQAAYHGQRRTLYEHELDDYCARVDDAVFGNCDHCRAVLVATVHAGKTCGDRGAIFREAERRANEFVRLPAVHAAIRALAAALMEQHTLTGAEAHAIIEPFVKFGELKNVEENPQAA